jgi:GST-like protein
LPRDSARFPDRPCIFSSQRLRVPNRYCREAERHYRVLNDRLASREFIVGDTYIIADISAWGWLDRASRVLKGEADPLGAFPNLKRWFEATDARPAVARARTVGKDHEFKESQ